MMDFENGIRILGKPYSVSFMHIQGAIGECDDFAQTIKIDPKVPHELQKDTLLHEVIHAIDYAVKTKLSEDQVSALASGLYAVFNDNPNFLEWLNARKRRTPAKSNPG